MSRRALLGSFGWAVGTLAVAGCTGRGPTGGATDDRDGGETATPAEIPTATPPDDCPTTQDIGVEPPEELDPAAVASFVESYEYVYVRDVVVEYEPASRLDAYEMSVHVPDRATTEDDAYLVAVRGGGAVYSPNLRLAASAADMAEDRESIPAEEVDDAALASLLEEAAEREADDPDDDSGEPGGDGGYPDDEDRDPELVVDAGPEVNRYLELLESLSGESELISGPSDSTTLHFEVDGEGIELSVSADGLHGDYGWSARYYVDERVVRRTDEESVDPREGELLECEE